MQSHGAREFTRHYSSDKHWFRDVTFRVQQDLPVYNQLMNPITLTAEEREGYLSQLRIEKDDGFNFLEDLLPPCTRADSSVPLVTMVNCVAELCRCRVHYTLVRKLWGCFRATLCPKNPLNNPHWDRWETLVSDNFLLCCDLYWFLFVVLTYPSPLVWL